MSFEQDLINGLDAGLRNWAQSKGALTVARNGGFEFAIRAHLLPFLEKSTNCLAFTEAEGQRFDISLCPHDTFVKQAVVVELKANFLCQSPTTILCERNRAVQKLRKPVSTSKDIIGRYYLHLVVELAYDAKKGPAHLLNAHNKLVGSSSYKRFKPLEVMAQKRTTALRELQGKPASYVISCPKAWQATATLYCWLASLSVSSSKPQYLKLPGYAGKQAQV